MGAELDFKLILTKDSDQTNLNGYCLYKIDSNFGESIEHAICQLKPVLQKHNLLSLDVLYNDTSKEMHIMPANFNRASINVSTHLAKLTPVPESQNNTYEVTSRSNTWCYTGSRILPYNGTSTSRYTNSSSLFFTTEFAGDTDILKKTPLTYKPSSNESLWWDIYLTRYLTSYTDTSTFQARQYEFYFEPVISSDAYEAWPTANVTQKPFLRSNYLIGLNVSRMSGWGRFNEIRFMVYSKHNQTHPDFQILVVDGSVYNVIPLNGTSNLFFDTFGTLDATDFLWNETLPTSTTPAPTSNSTPAGNDPNTTASAPATTQPPQTPGKTPTKKKHDAVLVLLFATTTVGFITFCCVTCFKGINQIKNSGGQYARVNTMGTRF